VDPLKEVLERDLLDEQKLKHLRKRANRIPLTMMRMMAMMKSMTIATAATMTKKLIQLFSTLENLVAALPPCKPRIPDRCK
jgi:hypothetical protein